MSTIYPPASLITADRPRSPAALLSKSYRDRLIERGFLGLYRWYTSRSQVTRNWNPDSSFDWRQIRHDLSEQVRQVLQGFFAVEQYAPDYTARGLDVVRRSHGRSHFQMRWGSEEEKHADTWENAVLFSRSRTPQQLEEYKYQLKRKSWELPWEDPLHIIIYTVFQERATQLNYLNLAKIARGLSDKPEHATDVDPVLAKVAQTIAVDEAAHYNFFLEGARLFLYYYPLETLEAIRDVLGRFTMPAQELVPDWDVFFEAVYRSGVYGPRQYSRDVVAVALAQFGVESKKALEAGIHATRLVPDESGNLFDSAIWQSFDPALVEADVQRLFGRIGEYEDTIGFSEIDPIRFEPNPIWPSRG